MQKLRRSSQYFITLCVSLCIAAPIFAQPHAEVGYLHADGTLQVDLSRFQPTLAIDATSTLPVADTALHISDGLVHLLRLAADQCTSESLVLFTYDTTKGTFEPIASQIPDGTYALSPQPGPFHPPAGPIFAVETTLSLSPYLTKCHDTGCGNYDQDAGCFRMLNSGNSSCGCIWPTTTPEGLPSVGHSNSGCTLGIHLRPDWGLPDSLRWQYIQNP